MNENCLMNRPYKSYKQHTMMLTKNAPIFHFKDSEMYAQNWNMFICYKQFKF